MTVCNRQWIMNKTLISVPESVLPLVIGASFSAPTGLVVSGINTMTFVAPNVACGKARGGSIPQSGAVTDEQRRHRPNSAQPFGRQLFFGQTSLLAPYRSTWDMLVAHASSGQKIPYRERHRIYA